MRISDWSSDVCSSDLKEDDVGLYPQFAQTDDAILEPAKIGGIEARRVPVARPRAGAREGIGRDRLDVRKDQHPHLVERRALQRRQRLGARSEEHTSELQSLMRSSYAVFCLKKKIITNIIVLTFFPDISQHIVTRYINTMKNINNATTSIS